MTTDYRGRLDGVADQIIGASNAIYQLAADVVRSPAQRQQARKADFITNLGVFVRGLDMNRRTRDGRLTPHWGVDIGAPEGTPVHAAKSGIVIFSRPYRGYGNAIMIRHPSGRITQYSHLQRSIVREGQGVTGGEVIGAVGTTTQGQNVRWENGQIVSVGESSVGRVTRPISPHLHMEVHRGPTPALGPRVPRIDPVRWLQRKHIRLYNQRWSPRSALNVS